jgi:type IV secretory pathway protease TraF
MMMPTKARQLSRVVVSMAMALALIAAVVFLPGAALALSPTAPLANFPTEQAAQQHCPADTVVWLNLPSGVYHFRGQRWYGATKSGAFVCQGEADRAGMRATRSGQ